ncbi:MAG: hypothetical protein OXI57_05990 [Rhodospirillales bacterium]|nr:hypothetical protein [Rhodospirillales bacterium]
MARKPNYRFARLERERNKAARKAARAKLKAERAELRRQEKSGQVVEGEDADETAVDTSDSASDDPASARAQDGEPA